MVPAINTIIPHSKVQSLDLFTLSQIFFSTLKGEEKNNKKGFLLTSTAHTLNGKKHL